MPPTVSFVVPVRNDAARLRRCLHTIRANHYPPGLEIIVVDNGSTDGSVDVARQAGARVVVLPGVSVSELRNRGASESTGEILAFVDADHEISSDWVATAADTLSGDQRIAAVGALCEAPGDGTWVQRTYGRLRRRSSGVRDVEWLGSGNMAVRRTAFGHVAGFDTSLQTCEDVDLCHRLRDAGYRILQDSRLRNIHLGDPSTLAELFRGELWRGRDNLRVSLRGRMSLREMPSIALPIADLGFLALLAAGVAGRSRPGTVLAILALCGILGAAAARATRIVAQDTRVTLVGCGQALAVTLTYDLARALALVQPASHDARKAHA